MRPPRRANQAWSHRKSTCLTKTPADGDSAPVAQVFRDDRRYLAWRKENPNGLVLNVAEELGGTVLHRVGCSYLTVPIDHGAGLRTYEKHCSTSAAELARMMKAYAGARACSRCQPL